MDEPKKLADQLDRWLTLIDAQLARDGVAVANRPFQAALTLKQHDIVRGSADGGAIKSDPDGSTNFAVTPWFRAVYKEVEGWYQDRYGSAFNQTPAKGVLGVLLIRGTPFAFRVPTSRVRPAEPGKTIWISFPDQVEEDDIPTSWLINPPNLSRLPHDEHTAVEADIREIAGGLRFVRTTLMGATGSDDALMSFRHGVVTHLERAAELITHSDADSTQKAWWELQMAAESALKGLLLQKTGKHPFTHNLNDLLDAAVSAGVVFDRTRLAGWPGQKEMSNLRYGQGTRREIAEVFANYRHAIALARAAAGAMVRTQLGQAKFKLQQPPWMRDGDAGPSSEHE